MIQDMTVGSPTKLILKFAVPLLIGNIFQQLFQISDIIIVGRLIGIDALAAVGASAPIYFVVILITLGFTGGLTVVTAQRFGAKDYEGVRRSVTHSLFAAFALSILLTALLMMFMHPLLKLMNVPDNIMNDAYNFMMLLSGGLIMIVAYNLLSGFIRALGDSKTPLYFLIFSSLLNILLNLWLIYSFKLGVIGSATGTVISMTISAVLCLIYMIKKYPLLRIRKADWRIDYCFMMQHLNIAIPMALQFSVLSLGLMFVQSVCNSFGANTIAAFTSALRIEQLATQPMVALGIAMATYSAQNIGAGMIGRIRTGVRNSSLISLSFAVFIALLVRFVGEEIVGIFIENPSPEIINTAREYLNISTLFYLFLGQIFIFRNTLQGMGDSVIPLIAGIMELLMRSFAAVFLAGHFGYVGICYAGPIAWIGASTVVFIGYIITIYKLSRKQSKLTNQWKRSHKKNTYLLEGTPAE